MNTILEQVNSMGKAFVDSALPMLVQSTILIVVLLALDLILLKRIRAVFRYWIWMIVLVKLVLPTTLSSPISPAYWFGDELHSIVTGQMFDAEESETRSSITGAPTETYTPPETAATTPTRKDVGFQSTPASSVTWQGFAFLAWLAAVAMMTVLLIQRAFFVRGLIAQSDKASDSTLGILERACEQIGINRTIALRLSPASATPSVCGLLRPTILIPKGLPNEVNVQHLKSILLHELVHIKRGDLWVSFIQTIVQIIYIYNPLLWVANAIIRKVREQAVDEIVLVAMGEQAEDYPKTLLNVSRLTFGQPTLSLRLIGVVESKKALIGRIKHITCRPFPRSAKMGISGFVVVLILGAALLPMAKAKKSGKADVPVATEHEEKSANSLHQAATDGDIDQVKSPISKGANVNAKANRDRTPLHLTAENEHKEVAELLIANGAEATAEDQALLEPDTRRAPEQKGNIGAKTDVDKRTKIESGKGRVVHFPKDRSLGKLSTQNSGAVRQIATFFYWGAEPKWEYLCEAKGEVHVPAGKRLSLLANKTAGRDLSPLSKLRPDDLYGLTLQALSTDAGKPSDRCMPHIANLTGLKSLNLGMTNVSDRGLKYISNLPSLEYLHLPDRATDRGLAYVAELPSLKGLYLGAIGGSQVTDAGLRHLTKLTSLEELYLRGEHMGDAGLAYLRDLPRLEYLALYGSHFTDDGCAHLKDIASLRILSFYEDRCRITDAGLVHISNLANLENLSLSVTGPVTDEGIAHLVKMRSLRKLDIGSSQVTDRGLAHLKQIKTLERLDLPQRDQRITDIGLAHLAELPNLKCLHVSRGHYVDPKMNKEYYTDKGLAELAKCRLLEELSIGSIGITDAGMEHITKLTNLKDLNLFGCDNVTDKGVAKLRTLKSLTSLNISHAEVTFSGLAQLNSLSNLTRLYVDNLKRGGAMLDLSGLTNLENVSLGFEHYSEDAFSDADLMGLANLKKLKWLQIGPRNYTDKGMAYLAQLPNIERLGIGGSGLTDEGLKHLTNMKKLNHLSIIGRFDTNKRDFTSGGNITDKGLRYLGELKMLRFLNIYTDNTFSAAAIQRLRRELPNLFYLRINGRDRLRAPRRPPPLR